MTSDHDVEPRVLVREAARIVYEVSGTGPPLLVLAAGIDGAVAAGPFASRLEDCFTVVRHDRRGVSRSHPGLPAETPSPLEVHADDAAELLAAVSTSPAYVFGASIGALIGLELLARHPDRVAAAVLHEPPLEYLVPDGARTAQLDDVAARSGSDPFGAIAAFGGIVGSGDVREPDAPAPARPQNPQQTIAGFLGGDFHAVRRYHPDEQAVSEAKDKLTLTSGTHSAGRFEALCSIELADALGVDHIAIDTGHSPIADFPRATARFLRERWAA